MAIVWDDEKQAAPAVASKPSIKWDARPDGVVWDDEPGIADHIKMGLMNATGPIGPAINLLRDKGAIGAGARGAARSVLPAGAGVAGMGAAMTAGAPLIAASGPAAPITAGGLALLGGLLGSTTGGLAQEGAIRALPDETETALRGRFAKDVQEHPYASFAGELAGQLPFFKPSLSNIKSAGGAIRDMATGVPVGKQAISQLANVVGGGAISGGTEFGSQLAGGEEIDPTRIAMSAAAGSILNEPTRAAGVFGIKGTEPYKPGTFDESRKQYKLQSGDDVRKLMEGAKKSQNELTKFLGEIVEKTNTETPSAGAQVAGVRVKELKKVKVKLSKNKSAEELSDYLGGRIIVNSLEDLPAVMRSLNESGKTVGPSANMFVNDKAGYRAYHAQVKIGKGMTAEVQVHIPEMAAVLDEAHVLYDQANYDKNPPPEAKEKMLAILNGAWEKYHQRVGPTKIENVPGGTATAAVAQPADVTQTALSKTLAEKGATVSVEGKSPIEGFVVSPYKQREVQVGSKLMDIGKLGQYVQANKDLLSQPNHFLGTWDSGDVIYLDVSVATPDQAVALDVANRKSQEAIYDVRNKSEIYTEYGRQKSQKRGDSVPVRPEAGDTGGIRGAGQQGDNRVTQEAGGREGKRGSGGGLGLRGVDVRLDQPESKFYRAIPEPRPGHDVSLAQNPTTEKLQVAGTQEVTESVKRLLRREPDDLIATDDSKRLFRRIAQALRENRIHVDEIPGLRDAGFDNGTAADLFESAPTFAGQTLNRLSQVAKQIKAVAPRFFEEAAQQAKKPPTVWQNLAAAPRRIVNIWRASLISQLATAMRNLTVFHQRYAFHVIEDAVNGAFETATGRRPAADAFGPALEDLMAYSRALRKGNRERVLDLISQVDPLLKEKLWHTPVSDVALGNKYTQLITTFNNAQEYFARTIAVDSVIAGEMRRTGATEPNLKIAKMAVDKALDMTFAASPKSKFGREFVEWMNKYPILNVVTYPFPRYLTNSVRAIWEYSPAGAMRLLHPKYQAILRSDDARAAIEVATKAALGSAMFSIASHLRNSEYAGERWYEVQVGGKTYDVRPFGPLLPVYMFIAQAIKDPSQFELRDYVEGTLGINRMAGTTLFITSVLSGKNPDAMKKKLKEFAGEFAGGFTVPLRTFQDFVAQFSAEEAKIRDTKMNPLSGPTKANIPFVSRELPEKHFVTRSGAVSRENPGVRQLTGLSGRTKNPLEHEIDRLGIGSWQLEPRIGERSIERGIIDLMGPAAEKEMNALINSARYKQMDDDEKKDMLLEAYSRLRRSAKASFIRSNPGDVAAPYKGKIKDDRSRSKVMSRMKQKGLLRGQVKEEMLR